MNSSKKSILNSNLTYVIAFVLPLVMMIALYYTRGIFPWGTECYLRSDMYHQYAPFFSELWHKIRNGESLTYSWDIGLGTNFTSLYAYYLASPSNWFIVLFPQKYIIEIMNAIIILKIAGSSLAMTYYITKHFDTKNCIAALFGMFYGMSGFIAAYSWNIMWLDCVILLPLIMLGLERLVNENKCIFYCVTLGLCIFTNYYISIMVCISVVIYFIVLMISYNGPVSILQYVKKFINFCIYSLLAGGLGACLLLPEFYTFSLSASSDTSFPAQLKSYFSILSMLTRQLINVPVHLGLEHFPNIYCGVAVFLLIPLYVMCKKINAREKIGKCIILLIFLTAFNLNIPNYIWHGLHFPNSLPCRQSFIYIFFVLTMCFEAVYNIKELSNKQIGTSLWISIGLLVLFEQLFMAEGSSYSFKIAYVSGIFILLYALLMFINNNAKLKIPLVLLLTFSVSIIECTLNMDSTGIGTTSRTSYLLDAVKTVTKTVADNDDSFYRMDKLFGARTKNDGAWHNYKTVSTFSSTCNAGMSKLFNYLGLENSTNAYGCNGLTEVTDMIFSVKYTISNKLLAESNLRSYYTGSDGEFIYKNNYTLPIGFAINEQSASKMNFMTANNGIENQNLMIQNMTGISDVFTVVDEFPNESECTIKPQKDGHLYLIAANQSVDYITVTLNNSDKSYSYSNLKSNNRIIDVGYVTKSDTVEVTAETGMNLTAYMLDSDKLIKAYNILNAESYQVDSYTDTHFKGSISLSSDKTVLFSIPHDAGWSVYVDGKRVDTFVWKNALLCVDVPAGTHSLELRYVPHNLILGCVLTAFSIIILIGIYVSARLIKNGTIHTDNWPVFIRKYLELPVIESVAESHSDNQDDNFLNKNIQETILDEMNDFDNLESPDFEDDTSDYNLKDNETKEDL
mgnify:FL=1